MLEFLKSILGDAYTEEIDRKISEEVGKAFVSRGDFNSVKTELKNTREQLSQRDSQLEELKKSSGDSDSLKQQISQLQQQNAEQAQAFSDQIAQMKVDHAVEKALTGANARNLTATKALLEPFLKDAKLGDDGSVKGLDEAVKQLCEGENTAFLFGSQKQEGIKVAGAKPASGMTKTSGTKEADYQARWTEAMKAGNTLSAIQVKREALKEGIILN